MRTEAHGPAEPTGARTGHRGRPDSFWVQDPEGLFAALKVKPGSTFLDLGCGVGEYSLRAARLVGDEGHVYALDRSEELLRELIVRAAAEGLANIEALPADITAALPLGDEVVDICFVAQVLHALNLDAVGEGLFAEIARVLRPGGRLAVVESHVDEARVGPPMHVRLSPPDVSRMVAGCGFGEVRLDDLGNTYMVQYRVR